MPITTLPPQPLPSGGPPKFDENRTIRRLMLLACVDEARAMRVADYLESEIAAVGANPSALSASDREICSAMNIDPERFAASRARRLAEARSLAALSPNQRSILENIMGADESAQVERARKLGWVK